MADETKDAHAKLRRVGVALERVNKAREQLDAAVVELEAALTDTKTPGMQTAELVGYFADKWKAQYSGVYHVQPRDAGSVKSIVKTMGGDVREIKRRIDRYFAEGGDPFYAKHKHSLALFVSAFNALSDAQYVGGSHRPIGCHHEPPCRSEEEHTARQQADIRNPRG